MGEQTPSEEQSHLAAFNQALEAAGFWEQRNLRWEYAVDVGGEQRRAVVTAVSMRGEVYALVQKAW